MCTLCMCVAEDKGVQEPHRRSGVAPVHTSVEQGVRRMNTAAIGCRLIQASRRKHDIQRSLRRRRAGANDVRVRDGVAAPHPTYHYLRTVQADVVEDLAARTPPQRHARLRLSGCSQMNALTGQTALSPPVLARSSREPARPPSEPPSGGQLTPHCKVRRWGGPHAQAVK